MSSQETTLWSTLIQNSWRREFNCPKELSVSIEEFSAELSNALEDNQIPARVDLRQVNWDDIGKKQKRILVRYTGPDAVTDVLRYMVGVDQMGRFSYVEEKTYFLQPELPPVPRKKKDDSSDGLTELFGWGAGLFVVGMLLVRSLTAVGIIMMGIGALLVFGGFHDREKNIEAKAWNKKADSEMRAYEQAWEEWERDLLAVGYLARTDDTLGRFVQAVRSTVAQVTQKLFVDRNAELVKETEQASTQEEIEAELAKRRKEAFG